jgi:hypothetical protein
LKFVKFVVEDWVGQAAKPESTLVQALKPEILRKLILRLLALSKWAPWKV